MTNHTRKSFRFLAMALGLIINSIACLQDPGADTGTEASSASGDSDTGSESSTTTGPGETGSSSTVGSTEDTGPGTSETETSSSTTTAGDDLHTRLTEIVQTTVENSTLPSVAALVGREAGLVALAAAGRRKRDDPMPVTPLDQFHLGSAGKAMTAAIVGQLVDEGQLEWQTELGTIFADILPEMDSSFASVTVLEMLQHRSGLVDFALPGDAIDPADTPAAQRVEGARAVLRMPAMGTRGEFQYSNYGFIIVGAIIEAVTGEVFEDLIHHRVFERLEMHSCGIGAPGTPGLVDQPWGHHESDPETPIDPGSPYADEALFASPLGLFHCSLTDWGAFVADQVAGFHGRGSLMSGASYRQLLRPPEGHSHAVGWGIEDTRSGTLMNLGGSNARFTVLAAVFADRDHIFLLATNVGNDAFGAELHQAMGAIIEFHGLEL